MNGKMWWLIAVAACGLAVAFFVGGAAGRDTGAAPAGPGGPDLTMLQLDTGTFGIYQSSSGVHYPVAWAWCPNPDWEVWMFYKHGGADGFHDVGTSGYEDTCLRYLKMSAPQFGDPAKEPNDPTRIQALRDWVKDQYATKFGLGGVQDSQLTFNAWRKQ